MSYTIEQLEAAVAHAVEMSATELADIKSTLHAARLRAEETGTQLNECMEARRTLLVTLDEMRAEENASYELVARQGDLLTGVVNALRGEPPPDTLWSHHDAAELARKVMTELRGKGKPRDGTTHAEGCHTWGPAHYGCALNHIGGLEAMLQEMHKSNHVLAAAAVPPTARADFSVACACGHAPEEHGHDPQYPGSTACTVAGCDCIAYERGE